MPAASTELVDADLVDTADLRGAQLGPCWHDCFGRAYWPPPGAVGRWRIRCNNELRAHTGVAEVRPTQPTTQGANP